MAAMPQRLSPPRLPRLAVLPCHPMPGRANRACTGPSWFETVYQDRGDSTGRTLWAVYHNENYPATLPFDAGSGEGLYQPVLAPGPHGERAPRPRSAGSASWDLPDGGRSWTNRGIFLQDLQPRMILLPHNTSVTFAGGVGDPSAVASGDSLYLFLWGNTAIPDGMIRPPATRSVERRGQCISVARIALRDLGDPQGRARRWDGQAFLPPLMTGVGAPVPSLQVPVSEARRTRIRSPVKVQLGSFGRAEQLPEPLGDAPGPGGGALVEKAAAYISAFNPHRNLGPGSNSQDWSRPEKLLDKPGHTIWYPSLQPTGSGADRQARSSSLRLGAGGPPFITRTTTTVSGNTGPIFRVQLQRPGPVKKP
jgi:hypothetical protein